MVNKYQKSSHISERKFKEVLHYFSFDIDATTTSKLTSISRNSINKIYKHIRIRISEYCEANSVFEVGEIELDESYFGRKMKGRRGRGSMDKIIVFGILKRNDKVYTQIVKNCSIPELLPIIEGKISKDSVIYTDGFRTYDCLLSYGYNKHIRINHSKEFADGKNHINDIENFWELRKVRLAKFRGISRKTFYLHLKECKFRYNNRKEKTFTKYCCKITNKQNIRQTTN